MVQLQREDGQRRLPTRLLTGEHLLAPGVVEKSQGSRAVPELPFGQISEKLQLDYFLFLSVSIAPPAMAPLLARVDMHHCCPALSTLIGIMLDRLRPLDMKGHLLGHEHCSAQYLFVFLTPPVPFARHSAWLNSTLLATHHRPIITSFLLALEFT